VTATGVALVAVGWLAGTMLLWRVRTPPPVGVHKGLAATASVVIPARNEAGSLPRLLTSLGAQVEPPLEVIVVNDGSTDATAALARAAGATVIDAPAPPVGWLGKPWACHVGTEAATGECLLFLDADTWLATDGVARLVAAHASMTPTGVLSVQPFHEVHHPYEQLSAICNVVPILASGVATPGAARSSRVAFGPCLVTRAADLDAAGGFTAVRGEIVEDAALARAYRTAGRPVRCLGGGTTVRFRMYPDGLRSLIEGWTKNLAGGAQRVSRLALLGSLAWVCAGMSVTADALTDPSPTVALAWVALSAQLAWMLRRLGSFHWVTSVLFPIPLLAFVALFLRSLVLRLVGRPVTWRGRRIDARRGTMEQ